MTKYFWKAFVIRRMAEANTFIFTSGSQLGHRRMRLLLLAKYMQHQNKPGHGSFGSVVGSWLTFHIPFVRGDCPYKSSSLPAPVCIIRQYLSHKQFILPEFPLHFSCKRPRVVCVRGKGDGAQETSSPLMQFYRLEKFPLFIPLAHVCVCESRFAQLSHCGGAGPDNDRMAAITSASKPTPPARLSAEFCILRGEKLIHNNVVGRDKKNSLKKHTKT